jgi:hypothetical protein
MMAPAPRRGSDRPVQVENANYEYNTYEVQYRPMQVSEWGNVRADPSPYSEMWESPQAFEPARFSENTKVHKTWNDLCWTIVFWLNFIGTIVAIAVVAGRYRNEHENVQAATESRLTKDQLPTIIGGSVGMGVAVNVVHYIYATCAPLGYIKCGALLGVVFSIVFSLIPVLAGHVVFIIFPILMIPIWLLYYCLSRLYFELSAAVLQVSTRLICRYPSTIFLVVLEGVWQLIITIGIAVTIGLASQIEITPFIYVYLVFSFLWISLTFGYVVYVTLCGLAGSWYFLTDTQYEPSSPVWESFKRAMTTSFGSAALAAFILAVIELLKALARGGGGRDENVIVTVLRCCALCILSILEACVKWINRYALIYCATFGVPFKEGCRRWAELSVKKFVDVIVSGCVIGRAVTINFVLFTVGGAVLSYGIGSLVYKDEPWHRSSAAIAMALAGAMVSLAIFLVLEQPIRALSDTILVCFAEAPERLSSSASELYSLLTGFYSRAVSDRAK